MSGWEWVGLVQTRKLGDARPKAVLAFLANAADEAGESWWSTERIAAATDISVRTVRRILGEFEADGLLTRERRRKASGQLGTWRHRLQWETIAALPWNGITLRGRGDGDPFAQLAPGAPVGHLVEAQDGEPGAPRGHLDQVHPGVTSEPQRENPSNENPPAPAAPEAEPKLPGVDVAAPKGKGDRPHKDRAHEITQQVWERRNPRPASPFIAAAKICERLLDAGHDDQAVGRAMVRATTLTTHAIEHQLALDAGRGRPGGAAPVSADERQQIVTHETARPEGRIRIGGNRS